MAENEGQKYLCKGLAFSGGMVLLLRNDCSVMLYQKEFDTKNDLFAKSLRESWENLLKGEIIYGFVPFDEFKKFVLSNAKNNLKGRFIVNATLAALEELKWA